MAPGDKLLVTLLIAGSAFIQVMLMGVGRTVSSKDSPRDKRYRYINNIRIKIKGESSIYCAYDLYVDGYYNPYIVCKMVHKRKED